nr:hypothetical protein [Nitrosomonas nitrosa]
MKSNKPPDEPPVKASIDAECACASASDTEEELPRLPEEKPATDAAELLPICPRDDPPGWPDL